MGPQAIDCSEPGISTQDLEIVLSNRSCSTSFLRISNGTHVATLSGKETTPGVGVN